MPVDSAYRPAPRHRELGGAFFDPVEPALFPEHRQRFRNRRWDARVGLSGLTDAEWIEHFGRFAPLPDNLPEPLALRYHGHQFQTYNPDLGDGRGFLFAQMLDVEDGRLLDLGTKGSGQTPWSRSGDGRLTLKGGVREVLATELLEALGVYTSKTLSLVETGEALERNATRTTATRKRSRRCCGTRSSTTCPRPMRPTSRMPPRASSRRSHVARQCSPRAGTSRGSCTESSTRTT
jgi:uncharacterized protein YdiU (UPF0061 family)